MAALFRFGGWRGAGFGVRVHMCFCSKYSTNWVSLTLYPLDLYPLEFLTTNTQNPILQLEKLPILSLTYPASTYLGIISHCRHCVIYTDESAIPD